jgi:two-component system LytT family sensor kinase
MKGLSSNKILWHVTVWLSLFTVMSTAMSFRLGAEEALVRAGVFLMSQAIIFYITTRFLIPKLLIKRRYILFALGIILAIAFSGLMMHLGEVLFGFDPPFIDEMKHFRKHRSNGGNPHKIARQAKRAQSFLSLLHRGHIFGHIISSFATLFLSSIIQFTNARRIKEREDAELKNEMLEAESKFLKSQINPHFLFNTMNNIYSLAQVKSEQTPDAILRLSGILRYVLYDSEKKKVKLSQEIEYLKQYIDLSLLKDEDKSNVTVQIDELNSLDPEIAPLILIPFVENAFKHSNVEDKENGFIDIRLNVNDTGLFFEVKNSIGSSIQKDETGGVGLENVVRRLELLYPKTEGPQYMLDVDKGKDSYQVTLNLDLK